MVSAIHQRQNPYLLVQDPWCDRSIERQEMGFALVLLEGRGVLVDFIEEDLPRPGRILTHIKGQASGLALPGLACIGDHFPHEVREVARID